MADFSQKMQELRRILKLHVNWLLYAIVGESALTTSELADLRAYGKLPMGQALNLVDKSYFLGRMRSIMKSSEFKKVDTVEVSTLTAVEAQALETVKHRAIMRLKNLAATLVDTRAVSSETWSNAVRTEFHTAKVQGIANTIANKSSLYASSDGPDSNVSVVPARNCCEDCREHYLDVDGNPKIFKLSDLMSTGSNADIGTIHTRTAGKHTHWKTTLPPLHPNCGCTLLYIPPGHGWADGKLTMLNKSLFLEHISKATAGVRGPGISPTVAPAGAPSQRQEAGHPSVPGAAAPGNVAGPGRPSGSLPKPGSGSGGPGGGQQFAPCPFGGGAECISNGGNGAAMHKPNGSIMKKHQEAMARGVQPTTPQAKEAQRKQFEAEAQQFNSRDHHQQVVHDHLSEGEIGSIEKLGNEDAGVNASFKVTIKGNGSGLMKPKIDLHGYIRQHVGAEAYEGMDSKKRQHMVDTMLAPGAGTMPEGMNPHAEAGASGLANGLGLGGMFPVTTVRYHDGQGHDEAPRGLTSVQHWRDNAVSLDKYTGKDAHVRETLKAVPAEHRDKVREQFATIAVMDVVMNNGDRHLNNVMVDKETHDLIPIDHGTAFGNGMMGTRNDIAQQFEAADVALTIPPALHQRLKNQTLDATFRSLDESGLPDWAKAQTYLRQKYVVHLQDKFDHIPFDRIRPTVTDRQGSVAPYMLGNGKAMGYEGGVNQFFEKEANNELPHQQFDGFAKAWMEERINNPEHPEHADAKRLFAMQPIRKSQHVTGREEATVESLAKHYSSIPNYDLSEPSAGAVKADMPKSKWVSQEQPARTPPEMPAKTAPRGKRVDKPKSEIELDERDLEEVSPEKHSPAAYARTDLHLDMDDFDNDADIDAAFERIKQKTTTKSLYLARPNDVDKLRIR